MRRLARWRLRAMAAAAVVGALLVFGAACQGEDRPTIEIIPSNGGTGAGTGTGSVTGILPATGGVTVQGTTYYGPVSDVRPHAALALDVRDISSIMAPAKQGEAVDWAAAREVYENGKNSRTGSGGFRTLASIATADSVRGEFPGGIQLDANIRAGLEGMGRGANLSDNARRQLVEKGMLAILYGKTLQELSAARAKIESGDLGDASGAPHNLDEAWAFYVGTEDEAGARPYSLSATAREREADFDKAGRIDAPLQISLAFAQQAARTGDLEAFDIAARKVRGLLNSIFYLATLKYVKSAHNDTDQAKREEHLAEGWAFYQSIRPTVAAASAHAGAEVQEIYQSDPSQPVPESAVEEVYREINEEEVLGALGIPANLVVRRGESATSAGTGG